MEVRARAKMDVELHSQKKCLSHLKSPDHPHPPPNAWIVSPLSSRWHTQPCTRKSATVNGRGRSLPCVVREGGGGLAHIHTLTAARHEPSNPVRWRVKRSIQEVPEPASCSCSSAVPVPARAGRGARRRVQATDKKKKERNLPARRLYLLARAGKARSQSCSSAGSPPPRCRLPPQSGALAVLLGWRSSLLSAAPSSRCTSLAPHWTRLLFSASDVTSLRSSSHRHHESESRTRMEHASHPPIAAFIASLIIIIIFFFIERGRAQNTSSPPPPPPSLIPGSPGAIHEMASSWEDRGSAAPCAPARGQTHRPKVCALRSGYAITEHLTTLLDTRA